MIDLLASWRWAWTILAGLALVAGCGREDSSAKRAAPTNDAARVSASGTNSGPPRISFRFTDGLWRNPKTLAGLLAQFKAIHPDVAVTTATVSGSSAEQRDWYASRLKSRATNFDVFAVDARWVGEFAHRGWLTELTNLSAPEMLEDFFPGAVAAGTRLDELRALPWLIDGTALFYRKDVLTKASKTPPSTWGDLLRVAMECQRLQPADPIHGYLWPAGPGDELVPAVLEYLWSNNGQIISRNKVLANTGENRTALSYVQNLIYKYNVSPTLVTNADQVAVRKLFREGKALFLRDYISSAAQFEASDSLVRGQVGMVSLPHFPGSSPATGLGGWFLGVSRSSLHPDAAQRFVEFLSSESAMKFIAMQEGLRPARRKLYRDPEILQAQPQFIGLENILTHVRGLPLTSNSLNLEKILKEEFTAVILQTKSPTEAVASLHDRLKAMMAPPNTASLR